MLNRRHKRFFIISLLLLNILLFSCQNQNILEEDSCTQAILGNMERAVYSSSISPERTLILETAATLIKYDYLNCHVALCENEEWIIYSKAGGCEVAYTISVSGENKVYPLLYVDLTSGNIFAAADNKDTFVAEGTVDMFSRSDFELP